MSEDRTLSAGSSAREERYTQAHSRVFSPPHTQRLHRRRRSLTISVTLLLTSLGLAIAAYGLTESMMLLIFASLMVERLICSVLSFSTNLLVSKGMFKNRFPLGLRVWELNVSIGIGACILLFGFYVLGHSVLGDYSLDVVDLKSGYGFLVASAMCYMLSAMVLHKAGIRSFNSRSEAASIRSEIMPVAIILIGSSILYLTHNRFVDPFISLALAVYMVSTALVIMLKAIKTRRRTKENDQTYLRMRDDIKELFNGELTSAKLHERELDQRYGRVSIAMDKSEEDNRHYISSRVEQYLLDEFDLDKANVRLRFH